MDFRMKYAIQALQESMLHFHFGSARAEVAARVLWCMRFCYYWPCPGLKRCTSHVTPLKLPVRSQRMTMTDSYHRVGLCLTQRT